MTPAPVPKYVRGLLGLYLLWTGVLAFLPPEKKAMLDWVSAHALLQGGSGLADFLSTLDGVLRLSAVALLAGNRCALAAIPIGLCALSTLSLLLTNPVWIPALGGFPAIGSGQGVIKALSLLGLAVWCWGREKGQERVRKLGENLALLGVVWAFLWIGGMKFTEVEAKGIEPLVKSHPLMSWLYSVSDLRGVSRLIGLSEFLTAALLLCRPISFRAFTAGVLLTTATFLTTLSFMLTFPSMDPAYGFPVLDGTGGFLLADLPMLLAAVTLWLEDPRRYSSSSAGSATLK